MSKAVTIQDILNECLSDPKTQGQTKEASVQKPSTEEIDRALEDLGLAESGTVKTASDVANKSNGGNMGLTEIYNQMFAEDTQPTTTETEPAAAEPTTKVASEAGGESNEDPNDFGSLVGHYFNVGTETFLEKVAAEAEASDKGGDHNPLQHLGDKSALGGTLGNVGDPHMGNNYDASSGAASKAMTGSNSPYAPLSKALMTKAILKRKMSMESGDVGGYNQK